MATSRLGRHDGAQTRMMTLPYTQKSVIKFSPVDYIML